MQALYHLQRGPILGPMGGHPDERAALATLLLNAAQPLAGRMLQPAAYLLAADGVTFQPVEPADLVLAAGQCRPAWHIHTADNWQPMCIV